MKRGAIISVILQSPHECQGQFNEIVSQYQHLLRGRMGIPFEGVALISLTVVGETDEINTFCGRVGRIHGVSAKASFAPEGIDFTREA